MRSRTESSWPPLAPPVSSSAGTLGGGAGGGDPSSTSITHLPRCTGEVRSATEVSSSTLPWPRMPRRSSGTGTRRNSVAHHVGDAVVPRHALVHEGVVGAQQVEDAAVVAHQAVEEQLGLAHEVGGERVIPVREQQRVGPDLVDVLQAQPLATQSASPALPTAGRPACAAPACRARRGLEAAGRRHPDQLGVGHRCPRGRTTGATPGRGRPPAKVCADARGGRRLLEPEHEPRARQQRLERHLDAGFEVGALAALLVERQQRLHVGGRGRFAVGLRRQPLQDVGGARRFFGRASSAGTRRRGGGSPCRTRR